MNRLRERIAAHDPGMNRLLLAGSTIADTVTAIASVWVFLASTHVLGAQPLDEITLIAIMLAATMAISVSTQAVEASRRDQVITLLLAPLPMLATTWLGTKLAGRPVLAVCVLTVLVGLSFFLRRYMKVLGQRVSTYGVIALSGFFTGVLAVDRLPSGQWGWIAVILWVTMLACLVPRMLIFWPLERGLVERTRRSFVLQARGCLSTARGLQDESDAGRRKRLRKRLDGQLMRLNQTALVIDRSFPQEQASGSLFALEVAIERICIALRHGRQPRSADLELWKNAAAAWPRGEDTRRAEPFGSVLMLDPAFGLPGSMQVSEQVSERWHLNPTTQLTIRATIATLVAGMLGQWLSSDRYFWAVLAVYLAFVGTNTAREQATKAIERTVGTAIGIALGTWLAETFGLSWGSLALFLVLLGVGSYFFKEHYWVMGFGITVAYSLVYQFIGNYTPGLLVLRLEETAIGTVVAVVAAITIFPVTTRRAGLRAAQECMDALDDLLAKASARLGGDRSVKLIRAARSLDDANEQFTSTSRPSPFWPFHRKAAAASARAFGDAAQLGRDLVAELVWSPANADLHQTLADLRERIPQLRRFSEPRRRQRREAPQR